MDALKAGAGTPSSGPSIHKSFRLPVALVDRLGEMASAYGMSRNALVNLVLRDYVVQGTKRHGKAGVVSKIVSNIAQTEGKTDGKKSIFG